MVLKARRPDFLFSKRQSETRIVFIRKLRIRDCKFPFRKGGIFHPGKKIKGLRGGVHLYAAQETSKIDTARAEKDSFRMETRIAVTGME